MNHAIEAVLRPDQVSRLTDLHCAVIPIDGELELYRIELPEYAQLAGSDVQRGGLRRVRHCAVIPLDPPGPKQPPPTMFKKVVWTDEKPAKVIGMVLVD